MGPWETQTIVNSFLSRFNLRLFSLPTTFTLKFSQARINVYILTVQNKVVNRLSPVSITNGSMMFRFYENDEIPDISITTFKQLILTASRRNSICFLGGKQIWALNK